MLPTSTPETWKIIEFSFVFHKFLHNRPFEVGIDFWSDLGANMLPFPLQKSTKNASKLELGRHQFFDGFLHPRRLPTRSARLFSLQRWFWLISGRFLLDFEAIHHMFDPKLIINWCQNDFKMMPTWYQNDAKMIQKWSTNDAKLAQVGPTLGPTARCHARSSRFTLKDSGG